MWFIAQQHVEYGPYSDAELRQLLDRGKIKPTDEVRRQDATEYVRVSTLAWLFSDVTAAEQPILVPDDSDNIFALATAPPRIWDRYR